MCKRPIRIVIPEEIPSENKGEAAILAGMMETFKCVGCTEVTLFSKSPGKDGELYKTFQVKVVSYEGNRLLDSGNTFAQKTGKLFSIVGFVACGLLFRLGIMRILGCFQDKPWECLLNSDIIIVGHDNTMVSGIWTRALAILLFAKISRKRIAVYGASIGPARKSIFTFLTKYFLNNVDLVTVRESISYEYVKTLGINNAKIFLTADTAFLLEAAPHSKTKEIIEKENISRNNGPMVGMTVTQDMFKHAFPIVKNVTEKYSAYLRNMAQVVDYLTQSLNARVVFVPHCVGPKKENDDRIVAQDIYQVVRNKSRVTVITNEYTPGEIKGLIGEFEFFIGERLHSIIDATSMCVPSIAISYPADYRTYGIIGEMLGQGKYIYDIRALDSDTLISRIDEGWNVREQTRNELMNKLEVLKEQVLLNGKLIREILVS